ncbi:hypothetical protein ABIE65_002548 [Constrictibacter sp. MBR-5]|jgi:16S rRNA (cytosine967-C5)-methyltransferase|uniref:hypothetical protein n=1 Tax=Constrictibacter sp. MBR-5 TaxID=3156467 RepID=UPI00339B14BD
MTPGARLAAAIDVLEEYERAPAPADAIVASYLRTRRYIGAKDRAAIQALIFGHFRQWARIGWLIERAGMVPTPRLRVLAYSPAQPRRCGNGAFYVLLRRRRD